MISLATWQHTLDRRNNEPLNQLRVEISDYASLKRQWGYGHTGIRMRKCKLSVCKLLYGQNPQHMAFYGHYVNIHNEKKKVYVGFSFKNAFCNVDRKKSFLFTADV